MNNLVDETVEFISNKIKEIYRDTPDFKIGAVEKDFLKEKIKDLSLQLFLNMKYNSLDKQIKQLDSLFKNN